MQNKMNEQELRKILLKVQGGDCAVEEAVHSLASCSKDELSYACLDHGRTERTGRPEVIFGEGKTAEQLVAIFSKMLVQGGLVLATRVSLEKADAVLAVCKDVEYHTDARMLVACEQQLLKDNERCVKIISAGTSDLQVAEEAKVTAQVLGNRVDLYNDIGVAGIHRMMHRLDEIRAADVLIVVAGMEGALPSVVAGLVRSPVIAVPTSVGYGTGFGGIAALLGMLNSCSPGIAVVNIDNGFGAACMADAILKVGVSQDYKK